MVSKKEATKKTGISDLPIFSSEKDLFQVQPYIEALSNFIRQCETPITIALQGGWGTGKTSFINLINDELRPIKQLGTKGENSANKDEKVKIVTAHFNTWQYSQFNLADNLGISFLSYMIDKLSADLGIKNELVQQAQEALKSLMRFSVRFAVQQTGLEPPEFEKNVGQQDAAKAIGLLKEALKGLINQHLEKKVDKYDRLVIFIDDLDRLNPQVAVSLLEVIKLFLDIENCVFVLAIDHRVIEEGISEKMDQNISRDKAKSFLDKMIQVPFKIPVEIYKYEEFLKENLGDILGNTLQQPIMQDLIKLSVGSNPRAMKRLINSYYLNNEVNLIKNRESNLQKADHDTSLLLAIICMQLAFQPLYVTLYQERDKLAILNKQVDESDETGSIPRAFEDILLDKIIRYEDQQIFDQLDIKENIEKMSRFIGYLKTILLLSVKKNPEQELEEEDIKMFNVILDRSDMTSTSEQKMTEETYYPLETFAIEPKSYSISGIKVKIKHEIHSNSGEKVKKDKIYKDFDSAGVAFKELVNDAATLNPNAVSILSDIEKLKKVKVSSLIYRFLLPENQRKVIKNEYNSFIVEGTDVEIGNSFSQNAAADNLYKLLKLLDYPKMDTVYVKGIRVGN